MSEIKDNPEELKRLEKNPNEGPVMMLNLLKFKPDGAAFYDLYLKEAGKMFLSGGGKVLFQGRCNELINGSETWDYFLLLQQPSRSAFIRMINNPEFVKVHEYRKMACERALLYAVDPGYIKSE